MLVLEVAGDVGCVKDLWSNVVDLSAQKDLSTVGAAGKRSIWFRKS